MISVVSDYFLLSSAVAFTSSDHSLSLRTVSIYFCLYINCLKQPFFFFMTQQNNDLSHTVVSLAICLYLSKRLQWIAKKITSFCFWQLYPVKIWETSICHQTSNTSVYRSLWQLCFSQRSWHLWLFVTKSVTALFVTKPVTSLFFT
jgi:hypothetical protein